MATRLTIEEINAILLEDVGSKDGAIEPLEIRDVATRRTHPNDVAHKVWGALDEGNVNDRASSEVFITEAKRDDLHVGSFPFEDESDTVGDMPIASESISPDNRKRGSFHDDQDTNGIIIDELTMEADVKAALRAMRPPSDNRLPPTFVQVGATGFDYGVAGSGPATTFSYKYQRPLVTITQLSPSYSLEAGGVAVTITGTNFQYGATVTFGGVAASSIVVVNSTTITCTNPVGAFGRATVVVRNPDGMEASAGFVYIENEMQNGFRISTDSSPYALGLSPNSRIYFTPYNGNSITLYNGATWDVLVSDQVSLSTSGVVSGSNYDVFAYNNAGVLALELSAAWTNDTTRADSLTRVDGTLTKTADSTRRYVGTVRSQTNGGVGGNFSSAGEVYVWNFYNQIPLTVRSPIDSTDSWSYANPNSVWRQVRATSTNCVRLVTGDPTLVTARATGLVLASATGAGNMAAVGVGIDSTTANSAQVYGGNPNSTTLYQTLTAEYKGYPGIGYRPIYWLETGVGGAVTYTFAGDAGGLQAQTGMVLEVLV